MTELCRLSIEKTIHTTLHVETEAHQLQIDLIWIRKGVTDRYQLFDRRPLGALKSKGKAKLQKQGV
jgi:hypothetical protein